MNYTKENINDLVKKLLEDIKRDYYENIPFDIEYTNDEDVYGTKKKY